MTSPITAEGRAKATAKAANVQFKATMSGEQWAGCTDLIASAIREAEDAALERAAAHCVKAGHSIAESAASNREEEIAFVGAVLAARACAERILALKSTKETGHE